MVGVTVVILNVEDRLHGVMRDVSLLRQSIEESRKRENIREAISEIGSISRDISQEVKKLEEWEGAIRIFESLGFCLPIGKLKCDPKEQAPTKIAVVSAGEGESPVIREYDKL